MTEKFKPSKQFILRGTIAVLIVGIILSAQSDWFKSIFRKKSFEPAIASETVGDLVTKDSNSNGIPDWEEKLWGLDPTVSYTNGVQNKTIIEQKRATLGPQDGASQNETDALARQLMTITAALGQSNQVETETLGEIATKLADSVEFKRLANHYSLKDIRQTTTSNASLKNYYQSVSQITSKYSNKTFEVEVLVSALESGDLSQLEELQDSKILYEKFARELVAVQTPVGIQKYHLDMINGVYGISTAIGYLTELPDNGVNALLGVALYKIYDQQISLTVENIQEYLTRYGII